MSRVGISNLLQKWLRRPPVGPNRKSLLTREIVLKYLRHYPTKSEILAYLDRNPNVDFGMTFWIGSEKKDRFIYQAMTKNSDSCFALQYTSESDVVENLYNSGQTIVYGRPDIPSSKPYKRLHCDSPRVPGDSLYYYDARNSSFEYRSLQKEKLNLTYDFGRMSLKSEGFTFGSPLMKHLGLGNEYPTGYEGEYPTGYEDFHIIETSVDLYTLGKILEERLKHETSSFSETEWSNETCEALIKKCLKDHLTERLKKIDGISLEKLSYLEMYINCEIMNIEVHPDDVRRMLELKDISKSHKTLAQIVEMYNSLRRTLRV